MVDMETIARVHLGHVVAGAEHCCLVTDASTKIMTKYRSLCYSIPAEVEGDTPRQLFAGFVEQASGRAVDEAAAIVDQLEQTRQVALDFNPDRYYPSPPFLPFLSSLLPPSALC